MQESKTPQGGLHLSKNLHITKEILGSCGFVFLTLGCVPAYFDLMLYAKALWILGFAAINTYFFAFSYRKM